MRIIHFEDEWAKTRSIAHRLHDRIFEYLAPDKAVNLDLAEEEDAKKRLPSKIFVTLSQKPTFPVFDYIFVTELDTLRSVATREDVIVIDIMRSDQNGRFVSILEEVIEIFRDGNHVKDNWRYFSAYPEEVPPDFEIEGFTKRQNADLVEFLFRKVREQHSWT